MAEARSAQVKVRVRVRSGGQGSLLVGFLSPDGEIPAFVSSEDVHLSEGTIDEGVGEVMVTLIAERGDTFVGQIPGESPLKGSKFEIAKASAITA